MSEEVYLNECMLLFLERKLMIRAYKISYKEKGNGNYIGCLLMKFLLRCQNARLDKLKSCDHI